MISERENERNAFPANCNNFLLYGSEAGSSARYLLAELNIVRISNQLYAEKKPAEEPASVVQIQKQYPI